ncbi:MAG: SRPBCC family protein [Thermomicrobiales bacterium]
MTQTQAHDEQDAIVSEVRIAAPPETVYPFLTDPARIVRWMGRDVSGDPQPGGALRVDINDWATASGSFVELVPNQRVSFTFGWENAEPVGPGSSTVEISLTPDGDGTLVRLVHRGLPVESHPSHLHGWNHYLPRLATLVTGGDPGPDPNATATAPASAAV